VLATLVRTEAERGNLLHQVAERHHSLLRSLPQPGKAGRGAPAPAGEGWRKSHIEFIDRSLKGLIRLNQLAIDGATGAFVAATDRTTLIAAALALLTILAASAAARMIARTITRPIRKLVQATQRIARACH
jgi:methyl-accepting chemotaxis protein